MILVVVAASGGCTDTAQMHLKIGPHNLGLAGLGLVASGTLCSLVGRVAAGQITASSNEVTLNYSYCWEDPKTGPHSGLGIFVICPAASRASISC